MQAPKTIPSQRHLFDIPEDVAYLNCAYLGPLMRHAAESGKRGTDAKARPWQITAPDFFADPERARSLFARIINTPPENVAIVPSASYGLSIAARNVPFERGQSVVLLDEQFPSNVYCWQERIRTLDGSVHRIKAGHNEDLTEAVIASIDDSIAVAALPHCRWTDGGLLDLERIAVKCRAHGTALVLDLTQSAGALPFNVGRVRPDFAVAASYKWLLGPYTLGFLFVHPRHHGGEPLEHSWNSREGAEEFARLVSYRDEFQSGARRYDMGEKASFHTMPIAVAAMEQILEWGIGSIAETLRQRNADIARRAESLDMHGLPESQRAGHFLGLRLPNGVPEGLLDNLAERRVFVSVRGDSVRITPHVYNTDEDVERLFDALESVL